MDWLKYILMMKNIKEAKEMFDLPKFITDMAEQMPQMQKTGVKKSIEQVEAEIDELLRCCDGKR